MADDTEEIIKSTKPYSKTLTEYGRASTPHGVSYIFENGRWGVERVLWGIIVIFSIILAVYWSTTAYKEWQDEPITTTLATNGMSIQDVPFPSITICAQGIVHAISCLILDVLRNELN